MWCLQVRTTSLGINVTLVFLFRRVLFYDSSGVLMAGGVSLQCLFVSDRCWVTVLGCERMLLHVSLLVCGPAR